MKLPAKIWIVTGCILLLLIILNPSRKDFEEYLGRNTYTYLKKSNNWLLFSIYEDDNQDVPDKYMGVLSNFIKLDKPTSVPTAIVNTINPNTIVDTSKEVFDTTGSYNNSDHKEISSSDFKKMYNEACNKNKQ